MHNQFSFQAVPSGLQLWLHKFRNGLCFCLFALSCHSATGQTIHVQEFITSEPIPFARIQISSNKQELSIRHELTTNSKGEARLDTVVSDDAQISIYATGYAIQVISAYALKMQNYRVALRTSSVDMYEVVISASRFEEKRTDIPRQLQTISQQQIRLFNPQNTADLLQNTGEVFVQKSQAGGGSPVLRGFEANKVLLVVDGVRMNNAIYRGGHLQNILRIDPHMLEKAEVVFGAGSVMYGSDALGGVMHFITRKPTLSADSSILFRLNASGGLALVNQFNNTHLDISIGNKYWGSWTSISFAAFGNMMQGKNRSNSIGQLGLRDSIQVTQNGIDQVIANPDPNIQTPSGYHQIDLGQKILFSPNASFSHLLNFQYSTSGNVPRYDRLTEINTMTGTFNSAEWYYGPETRLLAAYHFVSLRETKFTDDLRISVAYQYLEESRHNRNFNSANRNNRFEKVHVLSANADARKRSGRHEWMYGMEGTRNDVQSNAYRSNIYTGQRTALSTRYPDGGADMSTLAAYINHAYEFHNKLILVAGIRSSYVHTFARFTDKTFFPFLNDQIQQNYLALNGQLGAVMQPSEHWRLSVNVSSGFRAPNIDDLGKTFESAGGVQVILPNPDLKHETTYNGEVTITRYLMHKSAKLELTSWTTLMQDAIGIAPATYNSSDSVLFEGQLTRVMHAQNFQQAIMYGINFLQGIDLGQHYTIAHTINYTYGRYLTDSVPIPMDHIPPVFGRGSVSYSGKQLKASFFVLYNGWKRLSNYSNSGEDNLIYATNSGMPAWYTINLQLSRNFRWGTHSLFVLAGIENILDVNYRTFASGIQAPGRNFVLTVRYSLN
jgi:hemoglobin/transferrin/lactoferrin receptor protein